MKQYKPGQIITIGNRRYRIVKSELICGHGTCTFCTIRKRIGRKSIGIFQNIIHQKNSPCNWCLTKISDSLRLEPFKENKATLINN